MTTDVLDKRISFQSLINQLDIGEHCSRAREIGNQNEFDKAIDKLSAHKERLRNSIQPKIARARKATGGTYGVEIASTSMPSGRIFVVGVITRTA